MADRTGYEQDEIETLLNRLHAVGNFEKAGFGFPLDRVKIVSKHLSGAGETDHFTGLTVGEEVHPDEYIKGMTQLYRKSWFDPLVAELRRRLFVANSLEGRRKEASALKQEITLERAKLENLKRQSAEEENLRHATAKKTARLIEEITDLEQEMAAMVAKKAILAGELPAEVKANKRRLEL